METVEQRLQRSKDIRCQRRINLDIITVTVEGDDIFFKNYSQWQHIQEEKSWTEHRPLRHTTVNRGRGRGVLPHGNRE